MRELQNRSSQFAEVKAIQLDLDVAEWERWPVLYLYTDSWMVANALWGWLQQRSKITGSGGVKPFGLLNCGKALRGNEMKWRALDHQEMKRSGVVGNAEEWSEVKKMECSREKGNGEEWREIK